MNPNVMSVEQGECVASACAAAAILPGNKVIANIALGFVVGGVGQPHAVLSSIVIEKLSTECTHDSRSYALQLDSPIEFDQLDAIVAMLRGQKGILVLMNAELSMNTYKQIFVSPSPLEENTQFTVVSLADAAELFSVRKGPQLAASVLKKVSQAVSEPVILHV